MRVPAPFSGCLVALALALPLAAAAEDAALTLVDAASGRVSVTAPAGGGCTVLDLRDGLLALITPTGSDTGLSQPLHR